VKFCESPSSFIPQFFLTTLDIVTIDIPIRFGVLLLPLCYSEKRSSERHWTNSLVPRCAWVNDAMCIMHVHQRGVPSRCWILLHINTLDLVVDSNSLVRFWIAIEDLSTPPGNFVRCQLFDSIPVSVGTRYEFLSVPVFLQRDFVISTSS